MEKSELDRVLGSDKLSTDLRELLAAKVAEGEIVADLPLPGALLVVVDGVKAEAGHEEEDPSYAELPKILKEALAKRPDRLRITLPGLEGAVAVDATWGGLLEIVDCPRVSKIQINHRYSYNPPDLTGDEPPGPEESVAGKGADTEPEPPAQVSEVPEELGNAEDEHGLED